MATTYQQYSQPSYGQTNLSPTNPSYGAYGQQPFGSMPYVQATQTPYGQVVNQTSMPTLTPTYTQGGPAYNSSFTGGPSSQLYRPPEAEYVAPGRQLRGGMRTIYPIEAVHTFEAHPVFVSAGQSYANFLPPTAGGRESIISDHGIASIERPTTIVDPKKKKKFVCC